MLKSLISLIISLGLVLGLLLPANAQDADRRINADAIKVPDGYKVEAYAANLSVPTTAIFDGDDLLVAESGFLDTGKPRILRIKRDGTVSVVISEGLLPPVTGLLLVDGKLYVSHKGKVSTVEGNSLKDIVTGLPSDGDHQNNNIVLGPDGKIYMGQGTVTNSGVVGEDSFVFGWLDKSPQTHEIPCKDITLRGVNFKTENPLTQENDEVETGAYKPFGTPSQEGEVIKGNNKCGGSIVRFDKDGSNFELVAWGLRNPYGLEFDKDGSLWATFHGADVRGSRNIWNDPDYLVKVEQDAWYGWPEYFNGKLADDPSLKAPGYPASQLLLKDHPPLTQSFLTFDSHSAANGIAISPGGEFGHEGQIFMAMFGSFLPVTTGLNLIPEGYKVVKVDLSTKKVEDFAANILPGPAALNQSGGFDRPSDIVFASDSSMFVTDWGAATLTEDGLELKSQTGMVWRIYPEKLGALRPDGPTVVQAEYTQSEPDPLARVSPSLFKGVSPLLIILGVVVLLVATVLLFVKRK